MYSWKDIFPVLELLSKFKGTLISHTVQPSPIYNICPVSKGRQTTHVAVSKMGSCTVRCKGRSVDSSLKLKPKRAVRIHAVVLGVLCSLTGYLSTQVNLEIINDSFFSENSAVCKISKTSKSHLFFHS